MENEDFRKFREIDNQKIKDYLEIRELKDKVNIWKFDNLGIFLHRFYIKLKEFFR